MGWPYAAPRTSASGAQQQPAHVRCAFSATCDSALRARHSAGADSSTGLDLCGRDITRRVCALYAARVFAPRTRVPAVAAYSTPRLNARVPTTYRARVPPGSLRRQTFGSKPRLPRTGRLDSIAATAQKITAYKRAVTCDTALSVTALSRRRSACRRHLYTCRLSLISTRARRCGLRCMQNCLRAHT